jgi:hypothetical protein
MGIFSSFFGNLFTTDKNSLSQLEIKRRLAGHPILEGNDKETLRRHLKNRTAGGISRTDIDKVVRRMKADPDDGVSKIEAEAIRRKLRKELEG